MNTFFKIYDDFISTKISINLNLEKKYILNNNLIDKIKNLEKKIFDQNYISIKYKYNKFLFSKYEYIYPKQILDIKRLLTLKKNSEIKEIKIIPISLEENNFYYNNTLFVPLIDQTIPYDLKIIFYNLIDNNKYLISSGSNKNYLSLQLFAPDRIKNKTLILQNDIFNIIEIFSKNIYVKVENNYDVIFNPLTYGKVLDYNEVKFIDNIKVNFILDHMFNKNILDDLLENNKKYILIETRTKVEFLTTEKFYKPVYEIYLLYEIFIIINKLEIGGNLIFESRLLFNENSIKILYILNELFNEKKFFYSSMSEKYFFIFINYKGYDNINIKEYKKIIKLIQDKFKKDNDFYKKEIINYDINKLFEINKKNYNIFLNNIYDIYNLKYKIDKLFNDITLFGLKEYKSLKKVEKQLLIRKKMEKNIE